MSIVSSKESGAKVKTERDVQKRKQKAPSRLTAEGRQIDESERHSENARGEIRESREPGSNVTAERDQHAEKPVSSWREEGMKNDESDAHSANARSSIDER
jgi:hypothetical protein